MARLLPDFVSDDCKSGAERRLFERFTRELPNAYTILHSLGVAKHRYKLYSEADFVVVNQDAVVIPMYWMGNLVTTNRSLQGILFDAA